MVLIAEEEKDYQLSEVFAHQNLSETNYKGPLYWGLKNIT